MDENGCIGTHELTLSVSANPEPTISGSTTFCTGGSTTLDAGEGFETYLWNTSETSRFITVSTANTYSVEVEDGNGCSGTANIEVSESGTLELQIAGNDSFCEGESSVLDAGEGFVTYLWNTGETSRFINANSAETYSVEVEDSNGCLGSGSISMTMLSKPQINMSGNPVFCEGESTVLDAGNGYKTYLWNTGETSQSIEVTEAGTYTVTVTNEDDCSHSESIEVNVLPIPKPNITGDVFFCEGESTVLDAGTGFETYLWNTGEIGRFITVSEADTYEVEVTNENGCIGSTSIETNVYELPSFSIVGSTSFCQGSNTTLSVTGNFESYLWNTGENSKSILVDTEGTYSVEVTDQNGCKNTEEVEVQKTANLTPTITGDFDFCEGGFTLLDAGAGYFSHSWSTGETSRMINVSESGTYSVIVTDGDGCTGQSEVTVTAYTPLIPNIEGNSSFCLGESTTLDAGEGFESYIWNTGETSQTISVTTGGTFSVQTKDFNGCSANAAISIQEETAVMPIILGESQFCVGTSTTLEVAEGFDNYLWNTGETSNSITVTEAGFYEVEVIDENGCVSTNGVNVSTLEALAPTIEGELQFCADSNTTLEASLGYEEYQWSTGETSRMITVSESGNYGVLVTDANGCTAGVLVNVEERIELEVTLTGSLTLCNGSTTVLEVADDYSKYEWNTGADSKSIEVTEAGTYSVIVTDSNGCTGTISENITLSDNLEPVISGDLTICNAESTVLDAGSGFDEYLWNTGETTSMITVGDAGDYSVLVTSSNGCTGISVTTVSLIPAFSPTVSGSLTFCEGENTELIVEGDYQNYIWSTGDPSAMTIIDEAGTYIVVVTDENGCTGLQEVEVVMLPSFEVNITGDLMLNEGSSTLLDAGSYSDSDEYLWSTGASSQTLSVSSPDTYGVTVTDANGCMTGSEVIVDLVNSIEVSSVFEELQVLPNPFREATTLQFSTYQSQQISIHLFSIEGRLIQQLFDGRVNGGSKQSMKIEGQSLPAGVYVLQLTLENNVQVYERLLVL